MRRSLLAITVAVLLGLAGCSTPGDQTEEGNPLTDTENETVVPTTENEAGAHPQNPPADGNGTDTANGTTETADVALHSQPRPNAHRGGE